MGLDVTAYSKLTPVGRHVEEWCEDEDHIGAFAYACFSASFRGIPVLGERVIGGTTFVEGGCYAITDGTQEHGFRAGSYTGYNHWRDDLRKQFNPNTDPDLPFYELIWFADNEGCIGPEAAADLLHDFHAMAASYSPPRIDGYPEYYAAKYRDWTTACELAAESGLISFH